VKLHCTHVAHRYYWRMGENVIERAFQLAPQCTSIDELKRRLIREGYFKVDAHLAGRYTRTQILGLLNRELKQQVSKRP